MLSLQLESWAAWSPGRESQADWQKWCAAPEPLATEGRPEVQFLPPGVRRRCTRLSRMMLRAAFDCAGEALRSQVRTVFASRHGAIHVAVEILESIAKGQPASPMKFSHSVHNAQAGLFSIAAGNREASSSLAAEEDTFASAVIEAGLLIERSPAQPVLVVMGDEPVPETLAHLVDEPPAAYALALLLRASAPAGDDDRLALELVDRTPPEQETPRAWPQALEFLRWWQTSGAGEPLELGARRCYRFTRG